MQWISWHSLKYNLFCEQKSLVLRVCKLVEILRVCTFLLIVKWNCCFFHKCVYIWFISVDLFDQCFGVCMEHKKRLLKCPSCTGSCLTWISDGNTSLEWHSSEWFGCLCFPLIWKSGEAVCQYVHPVAHLPLWLSSWLEEKPYSNCGPCYMHLPQDYDGFQTGGIIWNLCFSVQVTVGCQSVCWLFVYLFFKTFIGDYISGRHMPFLHVEKSLACSHRVPLSGAAGLRWQLGGHSLAQSASVGLVWVTFPLGLCSVRFSWLQWTTFVQTVNQPKLHITISVAVYLVQEVFACLVFSPAIQRGRW